MPKAIIDEFTSLPISRQQRYQLRKRRDRKCIRCGQATVKDGNFCETHRQAHNVLTRELQRKRFDFKHRDYYSESYGFSFSVGRLLYNAANSYFEAGRNCTSPAEASYNLRVALFLGFNAVEAYVSTVADQFDVRFKQAGDHIDLRVKFLFRKLSKEPLDQTASYWKDFNWALKLRDQLQHLSTRSRVNVEAVERALGSIRKLLNALHSGIYRSRWA
ncbi:MAG TPA: hypothetical protein VGO68_18830 [Pyrinomonadaceae bacterium]|jgi:hypothetical protein|nr:hypothetical protein [Pyrinomonadaceae bacterium]